MTELMSWTFAIGFLGYGQAWRARRRYFHEYFHQGVVHEYVPIQTEEIKHFLRRALDSPDDMERQVRLLFVAMIVNITYGIKIDDLNDEYVVVAREAVEGVVRAGVPGAFWIEYLPFLKSIPSWVPGATFKRVSEYYKPLVQRMIHPPFQFVKDSLENEDSPPSVTKKLINYIDKKFGGTELYEEQEKIVAETMGAAYSAAADTTISVALCFLLAMAKYPDVQKKAQEELDLHIGPNRLPAHDDYSSLTFIQAIMMESMRWQPTLPLSIPHMVIADDEYNGYRIPKRTMVFPNIWAMLRDPEIYPAPETFNPDRFLKNGTIDKTIRNPLSIAFGFGRRICPGRHLSNNALFLFIASVLHVFNIEPATDAAGNPVPIEASMTTGLVSYPETVPCVLKPRSKDAEHMILTETNNRNVLIASHTSPSERDNDPRVRRVSMRTRASPLASTEGSYLRQTKRENPRYEPGDNYGATIVRFLEGPSPSTWRVSSDSTMTEVPWHSSSTHQLIAGDLNCPGPITDQSRASQPNQLCQATPHPTPPGMNLYNLPELEDHTSCPPHPHHTSTQKRYSRRTLPLPPGPSPLPVVGNSFDMPTTNPAKTFDEWSHKYGDLIYLHLPSQPTLIVNSLKSSVDLLERRSAIYSSRPPSVMNELMTWTFAIGFMGYGQPWRARRRYFHEYFHQGVVHEYAPIQTKEIRHFLRRALDSPNDMERQVRLLFVAMIVNIAYGIKIEDLNAEYVVIAREAVEGVVRAGVPGAFWIEYLPFLKFIPSWVPGAAFKRVSEYYKPFIQRMIHQPFQFVKDSLENESSPPSVTKKLIDYIDKKFGGTELYQEQEKIVMETMGVAYSAAADTTNSVALCFLLAMAKYPDVQKKAQKELDLHIGPNRLPTHEDYSSLIYIQAIIMESMRWQPTLPLSLPHMVIADDEYNGYRIPKGTTVFPNVWAMLKDPEVYPAPEHFNPDRFLKNGTIDNTIRNPLSIAFGFGRRICPGRHLSNNALFLFIASVLHVFNIEPATDAAGNPVPIEVSMTTGLISYPETVPCVLKPRSKDAEHLILLESKNQSAS
ncbi:hypothetical protein NLI96_g5970 [Meripilus lineatus]|uniref:O-methylsterigmatocystin oxidoreductase n=1 Tax=Meripilus lineatus TaxID=2056292 RepID=A0AAD5V3U1_9APHY|nr:hypothetical protein NLI96_g5970 [Physisporinus lineatus]